MFCMITYLLLTFIVGVVLLTSDIGDKYATITVGAIGMVGLIFYVEGQLHSQT